MTSATLGKIVEGGVKKVMSSRLHGWPESWVPSEPRTSFPFAIL